MGYIGQLPQANKELPGRATSTGEPGTPGQAAEGAPEQIGPRADELPSLLTTARSVHVSIPGRPEDGAAAE